MGCHQSAFTTEGSGSSTDRRSSKPEQDTELGLVTWERSLEAAVLASRESGRPIFALFQEVPGCATCQKFGQTVLSHPVLVEAIETLFVPLVTFNNKPEHSARMKQFKEPAWNNPVVRFLDAELSDVIPRLDRVWTVGAVAERMVAVLGTSAPHWLRCVAAEESRNLARATFEMSCFWQGEACLGAIEGVVTTRSGWLFTAEVVDVEFDLSVIDFASLVAAAKRQGCARVAYAPTKADVEAAKRNDRDMKVKLRKSKPRDAKPSDQSRMLSKSALRFVPLTPMQRTKINADLAARVPVHRSVWISPRQRAQMSTVEAAISSHDDRASYFVVCTAQTTHDLVSHAAHLDSVFC